MSVSYNMEPSEFSLSLATVHCSSPAQGHRYDPQCIFSDISPTRDVIMFYHVISLSLATSTIWQKSCDNFGLVSLSDLSASSQGHKWKKKKTLWAPEEEKKVWRTLDMVCGLGRLQPFWIIISLLSKVWLVLFICRQGQNFWFNLLNLPCLFGSPMQQAGTAVSIFLGVSVIFWR
jgi:hypothetical protein